MEFSDVELLARIILCEAGGEGENGMRAVATVVMNRVNVPQGEYFRISQGGNIKNIIMQKNVVRVKHKLYLKNCRDVLPVPET